MTGDNSVGPLSLSEGEGTDWGILKKYTDLNALL